MKSWERLKVDVERRPGCLYVFPVLLIFVFWGLTWVFVPLWAEHVLSDGSGVGYSTPRDEALVALQASGLMGDMFGSVNALFSGLAFAGVVLTLWQATRDRRRSSKPFIVVDWGDDSERFAIVDGSHKNAGSVVMTISINFKASNATSEAALNSVIALEMQGIATARAVLPRPLVGTLGSIPVAMEMQASGEGADRLVKELCGIGIGANLRMDCQSVEGVVWRSECRLWLTLHPHRAEADGSILRAHVSDEDDVARAGSEPGEASAQMGRGPKVALVVEVVEGSWRYGEAGSS